MKAMMRKARQSRKAQSIVEFALGSFLLLMLLAASVDLGRAFYTWIVVQNMAGEGAGYLATQPDNDCSLDCSSVDDTFQGRARNVAARVMGAVISPNNVSIANGDVSVDVPPSQRCLGKTFNVSVSYHMNDLFFPSFLGFRTLTIGASAPSNFTTSSSRSSNCPTPTPLPQ
jgi:Flp pilus assembly protein TadG